MPKTKEPTEAEKQEARRMEREARAETFKALGDPIRLAICEYLADCVPREQTAGAVCRAVTGDKKITAKVSHHLKELRRAKLIAMHKKGKNVLCALDTNGSSALCAYLAAWEINDINDASGEKNPLTVLAQGEEINANANPLSDDAPLANAA